ncbi:MAG: NADH-quinone oxidoreductase subunit J [Pseudomonadota bacterium]
MTFERFLFLVFAGFLWFAAVMVVTRRNPVHAVLFLILAFFNSAALWLLLEAEFLAMTLVIVYVGAVAVLFLFVVMMLDIEVVSLRTRFIGNLPTGLLVGGVLAGEMYFVAGPRYFGLSHFSLPKPHDVGYSNTHALGMALYTHHLYALEIAAVILLVAIVAAIALTLRKRPGTKYLDPSQQVRVKKGPDRVRLVAMPAEERLPLK